MKNLKSTAIALTFVAATFVAPTMFSTPTFAQSLGGQQTSAAPATSIKAANQIAPDATGGYTLLDATSMRLIKQDAGGNFQLALDGNKPIKLLPDNRELKLEAISQFVPVPDGTLVLDSRGGYVVKADNYGNNSLVFTRNTRWVNDDNSTDRFESLDQLLAGPDGGMIVLDAKGGKIVTRSASGKLSRAFDTNTVFRLASGATFRLKSIDQLTFDPTTGMLFVVDKAGFQLVAINLAYHQNLYTRSVKESQAVRLITPSVNRFRRSDVPDTFVTVKSITSVTVDKGLVCVADTAADQLVTMSPIGEVTVPLDASTQLFERQADGTRVKIELGTIAAPNVDGQGNRFYADPTNIQVVKIDAYGNASRVITKDTEIRFNQQ
ncbi:MAG: hypothetical protein K1Y36_30945 [Blastocatellia bacterium]|nr:hypothetical protein [Blastocatellia bacterium]